MVRLGGVPSHLRSYSTPEWLETKNDRAWIPTKLYLPVYFLRWSKEVCGKVRFISWLAVASRRVGGQTRFGKSERRTRYSIRDRNFYGRLCTSWLVPNTSSFSIFAASASFESSALSIKFMKLNGLFFTKILFTGRLTVWVCMKYITDHQSPCFSSALPRWWYFTSGIYPWGQYQRLRRSMNQGISVAPSRSCATNCGLNAQKNTAETRPFSAFRVRWGNQELLIARNRPSVIVKRLCFQEIMAWADWVRDGWPPALQSLDNSLDYRHRYSIGRWFYHGSEMFTASNHAIASFQNLASCT